MCTHTFHTHTYAGSHTARMRVLEKQLQAARRKDESNATSALRDALQKTESDRKALGHKEREIAALTAELNERAGQVAEVRSSRDAALTAADVLRHDLRDLQSNIDTLQESVRCVEASNADLMRQNTALETDLVETHAKHSDSTMRIRALENKAASCLHQTVSPDAVQRGQFDWPVRQENTQVTDSLLVRQEIQRMLTWLPVLSSVPVPPWKSSDDAAAANLLQHTATQYSTLQHADDAAAANLLGNNALQHTATHYGTLQHTDDTVAANLFGSNTLQHTATQYSTLQHADDAVVANLFGSKLNAMADANTTQHECGHMATSYLQHAAPDCTSISPSHSAHFELAHGLYVPRELLEQVYAHIHTHKHTQACAHTHKHTNSLSPSLSHRPS